MPPSLLLFCNGGRLHQLGVLCPHPCGPDQGGENEQEHLKSEWNRRAVCLECCLLLALGLT